MRLFVDTGAWYALYNDADDHHGHASAFLKKLLGQRIRLFTSDYIFDETLTLLRKRVGYEKAIEFGHWLQGSDLVRMLEVSPKIRQVAWEMFIKYEDKDFSFTDCTSFALMQQLKLYQAFAFDEHFKQMGFVMLPSLK